MITYNIKEYDNQYFENVKAVTDTILAVSRFELENHINLYLKYIETNKVEKTRSYEEYLFDMLSFGVYWEAYSKIAEETFYLPIYAARLLYKIRQKNKKYKKYIDPVRGILFTAFLYENTIFEPSEFSESNIKKFVNWLDATGEFREEVKRFRNLVEFINTLNNSGKTEWFNEVNKVIKYFNSERRRSLAQYTTGVKSYLENMLEEHRWKEDYIFCGRKEIEYHLSMVGAELMNRAFYDSFNNSDSVTLLVPACMRLNSDENCMARQNKFDMKCTNCNKSCGISQLQKKGEVEGFNVSIIPHSSDFTTWLKTWAAGKNKGVVGVACPLNLILGGLELKALEIPAQCVTLDFCGCKNHWDKKGIPTEFNFDELDRFLVARKKNIESKEQVETYSEICGI